MPGPSTILNLILHTSGLSFMLPLTHSLSLILPLPPSLPLPNYGNCILLHTHSDTHALMHASTYTAIIGPCLLNFMFLGQMGSSDRSAKKPMNLIKMS